MLYFIKTPGWLKKLYRNRIWELPAGKKQLYLSFDDGPHPAVTPFVLDELKKYGAKATFFCIGKNVLANPEIYQRILREGHAVGNHSFDHLNGWNTGDELYIANIQKAAGPISSSLYRPPYGKMKRLQEKKLDALPVPFKTIMWTLLSGDFDVSVSPQQCSLNILKHVRPGHIVVFHDSQKAEERLRYALPVVLQQLSGEGYIFEKIEL